MSHGTQLETNRLAAALREKRGVVGLRATSMEIGNVSAATLSRVEQGKVPDVETFLRICAWLGREPSDFTVGSKTQKKEVEQSTPELIAAHLRADRTLSSSTAKTLIEMIRLAYRKEED